MTSPGGANTHLDMHTTMTSQIGRPSSSAEFNLTSGVPMAASVVSYDLQTTSSGESCSESHSPGVPAAKASDQVSRNRAEQVRRSQFNSQINLMSSFLPDVEHSTRKVVKTSVLRLAANNLRNEHVFGNTIKCGHTESWSSSFLKFFDLLNGIMLGVTCRGRIFIVSPNVQEKLGYCRIDLLGNNLYKYVHPDDVEILRKNIYPQELQKNCDSGTFEKRHNFEIRIMRAGARSDPPRYEWCRIDGTLRRSDKATSNGVQDEQIIRRQRVRTNRTFSSSGNDFVFIGMIHILSTAMPARLSPPSAYTEYWTRHLVDGRIVQCDLSISLTIGYMTEEVTGASAFVFMHKEDVRWVICVLRQMYDEGREFGESYYRLMSRSGHFTYMRTRGFLEIDDATKKVQSFVCLNSIIDEDYGRRMLDEMKKKYSVIVDLDKHQTETTAVNDSPVEHPKRLERIVMHLVEPSFNDNVDEHELKLVPPSKENIISAIQNSEKVVQETGVRFDCRKRRKVDSNENTEYLQRHSELQDVYDDL